MLSKNKSEKRKYQRQDWPKHIKQWQKSGISQSEYCRQNGLNNRAFSHNKIKLIGPVKVSTNTKKFIKIPLTIDDSDSLVQDYEIILPGNIRIRTGNNFNPDNLKSLIQTLVEL